MNHVTTRGHISPTLHFFVLATDGDREERLLGYQAQDRRSVSAWRSTAEIWRLHSKEQAERARQPVSTYFKLIIYAR